MLANCLKKGSELRRSLCCLLYTSCFIGAIQTYDIPWVLSNSSAVGVIGGKNAFASYPVMEIVGNVYSGKAGNLGRACAEGFVLMLIIFTITLLQIIYRNRKNKDN